MAKAKAKAKSKKQEVAHAGTGRRKESVARVRLKPGKGEFFINKGRPLNDYFPRRAHQISITKPLDITETREAYDVYALIDGGGVAGQAGAIRHGIARALVEANPDFRDELKRAGMLTRDPRAKERKKYGLRKARKKPQFSKR